MNIIHTGKLVGGYHDGLQHKSDDPPHRLSLPIIDHAIIPTDKEILDDSENIRKDEYILDNIRSGDTELTFYRHHGLTPAQAMHRLLYYYKKTDVILKHK